MYALFWAASTQTSRFCRLGLPKLQWLVYAIHGDIVYAIHEDIVYAIHDHIVNAIHEDSINNTTYTFSI